MEMNGLKGVVEVVRAWFGQQMGRQLVTLSVSHSQ